MEEQETEEIRKGRSVGGKRPVDRGIYVVKGGSTDADEEGRIALQKEIDILLKIKTEINGEREGVKRVLHPNE